jgi:hypothetical protein
MSIYRLTDQQQTVLDKSQTSSGLKKVVSELNISLAQNILLVSKPGATDVIYTGSDLDFMLTVDLEPGECRFEGMLDN